MIAPLSEAELHHDYVGITWREVSDTPRQSAADLPSGVVYGKKGIWYN